MGEPLGGRKGIPDKAAPNQSHAFYVQQPSLRSYLMSEKLLAIDTALNAGSIALFEDGVIVASTYVSAPRRQAELLAPSIKSLLALLGWSPSQLDVIAVSAGPGSYTGLRIGLSTAKGLAFAVDADIVAVSTLEGLAHAALAFASEDDLIVPCIDARRADVFAAAYRTEGRRLEAIIDPVATSAEVFSERLPSAPRRWFLGDGAAKLAEHIEPRDLDRTVDIPLDAIAIGTIGYRMWKDGHLADLDSLEPTYLREFVAMKPIRSAFEKLPF